MVVDGHAIVRDGLQEVLNAAPDMEVVGQAVDGETALLVAIQVQPDVIIMDLMMPNEDGVDACRKIIESIPNTRVVILTAATADDLVIKALAAGATGYLQKFSGRDDLLKAVRDAADGKSQISVDMIRRGLQSARPETLQDTDPSVPTLSPREQEVLKLFARGNSYAQVAEFMGNSPITVRNTIYRIEQKLGVKTKQEIVVWAVRSGLLNGQEDDD